MTKTTIQDMKDYEEGHCDGFGGSEPQSHSRGYMKGWNQGQQDYLNGRDEAVCYVYLDKNQQNNPNNQNILKSRDF